MVNKDILTDSQCAVQAAHSVAEYMFYYKNNENTQKWFKNHKTMVILKCNADQIERKIFEYQIKNRPYKEFREEDLDNQITAVTFEPIVNSEIFKKYELL